MLIGVVAELGEIDALVDAELTDTDGKALVEVEPNFEPV